MIVHLSPLATLTLASIVRGPASRFSWGALPDATDGWRIPVSFHPHEAQWKGDVQSVKDAEAHLSNLLTEIVPASYGVFYWAKVPAVMFEGTASAHGLLEHAARLQDETFAVQKAMQDCAGFTLAP